MANGDGAGVEVDIDPSQTAELPTSESGHCCGTNHRVVVMALDAGASVRWRSDEQAIGPNCGQSLQSRSQISLVLRSLAN